MLLFNGKYTIWGGLITILTLFSLFQSQNAIFGSIIWFLYLVFFGYYLGQFFLPQEKRIWQIFFGVLGILGLFLIISSAIYWFYLINAKIFALLIVLLPIFISFFKEPKEEVFSGVEMEIDLESYSYIKSHLFVKLLAIIVICGQVLLLFTLLSKSFTDTLISPWTIIGPKFFLFFACITFFLFWILQKSRHTPSNLFLIFTHTLLSLSVLIIIFKYGFGFDPIIHEATAEWIASHGFILPKQPYYIGQYMLVIANNFITHWSVATWNQIIVPLGASFIIPLSLYFPLSRRDWKYKIFPTILCIFFFPLAFFTATTPNNLAILLALTLSCWIWYEGKFGNQRTQVFGFILALTICTIHPFIGLPMLIIYLGSLLIVKNKYQTVLLHAQFFITALIVPLAFYVNSWRLGEKLSLKNPLTHLADFTNIFVRPYWFWLDKGNWAWKLLYYYRDAIKPLAVVIVIIGMIIVWKKYHEPIAKFFLISALGLVTSSFILATCINYPDVISYEQKAYAMRFLELTLVMLLPFFVIAVREFFIKIKGKIFLQFVISILFAGLLLISLYFTYPTRDPISFYTGYNVREADITAVNFIENRNKDNSNYLVLTNQTVASAALKTFGFGRYLNTSAGEQYFYSIPTGGPLYQYFRKMVYEEPKREWMEEAMKFANVKKAYFVHTNYWAPAAEIRDKAKLETDNWWELAEGRVWVYEYELKS